VPVIQTPEHDLDPVSAFRAALVVFHGLDTGLPASDARLYPLVFQRISEPISIIIPVTTRGLPWLFGKKGRRRSISTSVGQKRSLIIIPSVRAIGSSSEKSLKPNNGS
jgi:hypothetical protein